MSLPSDSQLIRQVLAGARARYSVLIQRHQDTLHRYALGMVPGPSLARELVEQAFVDAYAALDECTTRERFDLWALRMLRPRCFTHLAGGTESTRGPEPPGPGDSPSRSEPPGQSSPLQELRHMLPDPEEREAFLLVHVQRLGFDDVVAVLDVSPDAVRDRVRRARERLLIQSDSKGPIPVEREP